MNKFNGNKGDALTDLSRREGLGRHQFAAPQLIFVKRPDIFINLSVMGFVVLGLLVVASSGSAWAQEKTRQRNAPKQVPAKVESAQDPGLKQYGIYASTAPRPATADPIATTLPLAIQPGSRIGLIGNLLIERAQNFGYLETLLHQRYPNHRLVIRNLGWPADTVDLRPRPSNFADVSQHLFHERVDVILAAYGFNESFAGENGLAEFEVSLRKHLEELRSKAFNGKTAPSIVLLSPIANEDVEGVAASANNEQIAAYTEVMQRVASQLNVGFIDLFHPTLDAMEIGESAFTINGAHLNDAGYALLGNLIFRGLVAETPPKVDGAVREVVIDKNRQFLRRYRPLNTFYYTGGRSKTYGYLDFLPAMRNFEVMSANRDQRIWSLAKGEKVPDQIDDSNVPQMPETKQSRGANRWMSAEDEQQAFKVDPRFDVTLFASEEQFPEIAAPIQMRWDRHGRLWVSTSTTYPHVYPGMEPDDKLVILEDTDGDGRADKSTVFADDLHIPLSFELGDGGVYVSEPPHLTFLRDTDGDDKADERTILMSGFGTEDSHHSLHDFAWTPDGDLILRESIFHHSQVETPYGPVRQQNSGWFRYQPDSMRLTSFGSYASTNPWGVAFDDWGQHVASHPIFAAAFHSLDPPYPKQHAKPAGLRAYSGTCGQEFIDFSTFPDELQGGYVKARYKPTNRIEIHRWKEGEFGWDEEYVSDLLFSSNLSFIPVDIRFGPRGALYICDWYNPVKGHAQYSLRDERRDRHSGRIWRITTKGKPLLDAPRIADATVEELIEQLKRRETRVRYWVRRELRAREASRVVKALDQWLAGLSPTDPRYRHHQLEALWVYRGLEEPRPELLTELLSCENKYARAAATQQLRYWHQHLENAIDALQVAANDPYAMVRMEAAIAASYIGTAEALNAMFDVLNHPVGGHLAYAIQCALGSRTLRPHWESEESSSVAKFLQQSKRRSAFREPTPSSQGAQFDQQSNLAKIEIGCLPEVMRFTKNQFMVQPGQPVKVVFTNPDATDHNFVIVQPGALEEVGMAANEMARDPKNANSDFIPKSKQNLILHHTKMIGPTRKMQVEVLRFEAPKEPGVYPYVCTFPGHWVVMNGVMVVAKDAAEAERLLELAKPKIVQQWTMSDFGDLQLPKSDDKRVMRGMSAFAKANCHQCHVLAGHGVNLGPDLSKITERYRGQKLLRQLLDPSSEINKDYQTFRFLLTDGRVVSGVIVQEDKKSFQVVANLLTPDVKIRVEKDAIEQQIKSSVSAMPAGLLDVLTKDEIIDLLVFLQTKELPKHLKHHH
ncbi:MAG: GDSL-type esterase/lipase family protein [Rubripirellula sp.]|nr:GDSL-type esterase/lipase family protein [Rubripirellula sp.]